MTRTVTPVYLLAALMLVLCLLMTGFVPLRAEESFKQPELPQYPTGATIFFTDSFMRENPEEGEWKKVSGSWEFDKAAKEGVSANPFSLHGRSPGEALLVAGEKWWRNYMFRAALRTPPIYSSFGLASCLRNNSDMLFFGFEEKTGLVLQLRQDGKSLTLASEPTYPIPYQWYSISVAVAGKRAFAYIDQRLVFSVNLPIEICGNIGIYLTGAPDYGVTVDDCLAVTIPSKSDKVEIAARSAFEEVLWGHNLSKQMFPSYFTQDPIMRKWASVEADWLPVTPPLAADGTQPEFTVYSYTLPVFTDLTVQCLITDKTAPIKLDFLPIGTDPLTKPSLTFSVSRSPGLYTLSVDGTKVGDAKEFGLKSVSQPLLLHFESGSVILSAGADTSEPIGIAALVELLGEGLLVEIQRDMMANLKAGLFHLYSSCLLEETFFEAPTNWLMVYGNWEIGSRWACSPQYSYLASQDPMTSQLYSKNMYSGKIYSEVWLAAKMQSFMHPEYNPFQWFAVSIPDEPGDNSTGMTFTAAYPTPNDMTILTNGKISATGTIKEKMEPKVLHNSWMHLRVERDNRETAFKFSLVDRRPSVDEYKLSVPARLDNKPKPFVVWNSLTGVTACRIRVSAQGVHRGAMPKAFHSSMPAPCGTDTAVEDAYELTPDAFPAPSFDFSKGNAAWKIPANQPALKTTPYMQNGKRIGVTIDAPFCGSRLAFESPQMAVDARIWRTLNIRYRTDVTLSFYIHAGNRTFRVLLNGRGKANPADWAIPVDQKYFKRSIEGVFSRVTIDLFSMFEEYCTIEIPPIIDKLSLERLDIYSPSSLGVEEKDRSSYTVSSVSFSSSIQSVVPEVRQNEKLLACGDNASARDFWEGLSAKEVRLPADKRALLIPEHHERPYSKEDGALYMSFEDGFRGLTPIGGSHECMLWRERIDKESCLSMIKTGYHGYYGVRLLPEPISLVDLPAMSIKYHGNIDAYFLLVKADEWYWIPLKPSVYLDMRSSPYKQLPPRAAKPWPMVCWNDKNVWMLISLADLPQLANKNYIEEIYISSNPYVTVECGTAVSISSILFYDPQRVPEFERKGNRSSINRTFTMADKSELSIRDIKLDKLNTVVQNVRNPSKRPLASTATMEVKPGIFEFAFDLPVAFDEVEVYFGKCKFTGKQLRYGESSNKLVVKCSAVFNDAAGNLDWRVVVIKGRNTRQISSGTIELVDANPAVVDRIVLIPSDSLVFEDYEQGIGVSSSRKSPGLIGTGNPFMGRYSFGTSSPEGFSFSTYLYKQPFDAVRYPFLSFNYRSNKMNSTLMAACEGHFKDAEFGGSNAKLVLYKDIYYYIGDEAGMTMGVFGKVPDVKLDDEWHYCNVNLLSLFDAKIFSGRYIINELCIREANRQPPGAGFFVDNICVYGRNSTSFEVRLQPPPQLAGSNIEYEWRLYDLAGMPVSLTERTKETTFTVNLPEQKNLVFQLRLVIDGKLSDGVYKTPLAFTSEK